jgi:hypothetical protein
VKGSVPAAAVAVGEAVVVAPTGGVIVVPTGGVVVVPTGGGVVLVPVVLLPTVPQSAGTLYDWQVELAASAALGPIMASTPINPTNAAIRFMNPFAPSFVAVPNSDLIVPQAQHTPQGLVIHA